MIILTDDPARLTSFSLTILGIVPWIWPSVWLWAQAALTDPHAKCSAQGLLLTMSRGVVQQGFRGQGFVAGGWGTEEMAGARLLL